MRTEQQKPQPRSNQAPKRIGGDEECLPLLMYFMPFPMTAVHRQAEQWQPEMMGSDEVHSAALVKAPSQWSLQLQGSHSRSPQVWDRCVCSLPASPKLSVLRALPGLLQPLEAKLLWFHLHQLQSMYSRVHRSNFSSSFRLFRLACDNGCVFKVFWNKLAGGHGHVKQGIVFAKTFCQFIQTDGKAVLCERPCSRSSEMRNKM